MAANKPVSGRRVRDAVVHVAVHGGGRGAVVVVRTAQASCELLSCVRLNDAVRRCAVVKLWG